MIRSQREWLRIRQALNRHRSDLTRLATQLYPPEVRVGDTGLLVPEDWRLAKPIPLDSIELVWTQAPAPVITGHHEETRPLRPLTSPQRRYDRYHKAMRDLDRPRLFENRVCYRLLGVERMPAHDAATLAFGHMRYFHMIDVGEALAHELARTTSTPTAPSAPTGRHGRTCHSVWGEDQGLGTTQEVFDFFYNDIPADDRSGTW